MARDDVTDGLKQPDGLAISYAVLMVVFGVLAAVLPLTTSIEVATIVSWAMLAGGVAHLAYALAAEHSRGIPLRLAIGILYIAGGFYLVLKTSVSLSSLTLIFAVILYLEGMLRMISFFQTRSLLGALWISLDGVVAGVLGFLVIRSLPDSSAWAIGTLVGIKLSVSGVTRLAFSLKAQRR